MGRSRTEDGAWDEARVLLQRALALDPGMVPALRTLANLELSLDHLAVARQYAEHAASTDETDPENFVLLGNIALAEHDAQAALQFFRRAEILGDHSLELRFNSGLAYLFLGQAETAREMFTRIVDEQPTHQQAWDALGCALRVLKDYQSAVTAFLQALQIDPHMNDARDHLAQLLLETGNARRARQVLESALALEPQRATTRHLLGMAYSTMQQFLEAISCWQALVMEELATAETYHMLANAYMHLGERPRAQQILRELTERYPDHLAGLLQLALLLLEHGEHHEGLALLEKVRAQDPQNPALRHALAAAETFRVSQTPVISE